MDCIFCKIIAGEIPSHQVYEDDATVAFLDINPASRGHTLVVPKHHTNGLYDIEPDALSNVAVVAQRIALRIRDVLHPDGLNIVQNSGAAAGQAVFHYHVHVIPRWHGDDVLKWKRPSEPDSATLGAIAAELRSGGE